MIADFHNDYLTDKKYKTIIEKYKDGDNKIVGAIFKNSADYVYAKSILNYFLINKSKNLYFAFEDFSYDEDIHNLIYGLLRFKPAYVGLTWNYENNLAYGSFADGKIKARGIEVIKALNIDGVFLDVAHLCEKSFYDALNYTDSILCSHTCFYDVLNHPRNLKKEQLKKIIELGGLVGLTLYRPFLTHDKTCTVEDVFGHVDYFAQNFGTDNLSLGTDFYGCNDFPEGFSDYDFESEFRGVLLKNGYSEKSVNAVLYDNLSNFLERACPYFG